MSKTAAAKASAKEFNTSDVDHYLVSGELVNGQKFRQTWDSYLHAMGINLYRGKVWAIMKPSDPLKRKRILLKDVWN